MTERLVIVGAGAGGASVAAEAKRRNPALDITLVEEGPYVSTAACPMPYYIGNEISDPDTLIARTPDAFRASGIDVLTKTAVTAVDPEARAVTLASGSSLAYDRLVLATGVRPVVPPLPGMDRKGVFTFKTLTDAIALKTYLEETSCRKAVIVGAGFIGLEMAENLRRRGLDVAMVHRGALPANRWDADLAKALLEEMTANGVEFLPETSLQGIESGKSHRHRLETDRGPVEGDAVLLAIGVRPHVALAETIGITLGRTGAIAVDNLQRTSREDVYAVGDCAESFHRVSRRAVHYPLGDIANKQGRLVGRTLAGRPSPFPGVVGAQSFRFFGLEAAATGLDEREARESGFEPVGHLLWGSAVAGPMPGPRRLGLKLIADAASGRLLGAQAVGVPGSAVGRINTLSAILWASLTLEDVTWMDLAYAPPFGGAWDLIHTCAQALLKKMAGQR